MPGEIIHSRRTKGLCPLAHSQCNAARVDL